MNMLHRQGSVFSYVQTEGETLTLETEYLMTSDGRTALTSDQLKYVSDTGTPELGSGPEDTWYDTWTPEVIRAVERVMRSLVLPFANNNNGDSAFNKPPIVKIVMGKEFSDKDPASNNNLYPMLTYPIADTSGKTKFYHRTYVVSKVTINKDMEESPLYVDDDGYLIDTHGFKLSLELTEIDYNYIGVLPDFGEYYNSYKSLGNNSTSMSPV